MSRVWLNGLCMISVLAITIVGVMFFSAEVGASGSEIILDGADYTSTMTNEYSGLPANVTSEVTSRLSVEYGDFNSKLELSKSGELGETASAVSSSIVVEYADSASTYESKSSAVLEQAATPVPSRITVEYADFIFGSRLGPKPMEDGTAPTIGTPFQEPSSDVAPYQNVTISVNITDTESGVKNTTLHYSIDNGTTWTAIVMGNNSASHLYIETIPGQSEGTNVTYKIVAYDNAENMAVKDNATHYYTYTVIPEFPSFLILPLFMTATLIAVIAYKRKHQRSSEARKSNA